MKKVFLSALVCLAVAVVSCGCKVGEKGFKKLLLSDKANIDTLSYIVGMDIANSIDKNMVPMFKVDYNTVMDVLVQALDPKATIEVEGESFNKENFREIGDKYMSSELQGRIMAAQGDSTATIYTDEKEKKIVSAILGADIAYSAMNVQFDIDKRSLVTAIDEIHNGKGRLTMDFAMEYTRNYFTVVLPENNRKESEAWLAEIEKQEGVQKTESGLLYRIDRVGNGAQPTKDSDVVLVHYVGKNCHGEVFDSSYQRGESISFPLDGVIKGWTEGMKYVRAGGQITLWIPAELAYGDQDKGTIGPGDALEFKVELLEVNPKNK